MEEVKNTQAGKTSDELRAAFEALYGPMGFDLTRWTCAAPEPWAEYDSSATGYAWAGYLAASSARSEEMEADKRDAERYRFLRNLLSFEDVERLAGEFFGTPDELESVKTDEAVDAARAALTPKEKP